MNPVEVVLEVRVDLSRWNLGAVERVVLADVLVVLPAVRHPIAVGVQWRSSGVESRPAADLRSRVVNDRALRAAHFVRDPQVRRVERQGAGSGEGVEGRSRVERRHHGLGVAIDPGRLPFDQRAVAAIDGVVGLGISDVRVFASYEGGSLVDLMGEKLDRIAGRHLVRRDRIADGVVRALSVLRRPRPGRHPVPPVVDLREVLLRVLPGVDLHPELTVVVDPIVEHANMTQRCNVGEPLVRVRENVQVDGDVGRGRRRRGSTPSRTEPLQIVGADGDQSAVRHPVYVERNRILAAVNASADPLAAKGLLVICTPQRLGEDRVLNRDVPGTTEDRQRLVLGPGDRHVVEHDVLGIFSGDPDPTKLRTGRVDANSGTDPDVLHEDVAALDLEQVPSPGAECPAIVRFGAVTTSSSISSIVPPVSNKSIVGHGVPGLGQAAAHHHGTSQSSWPVL